MRVLDCLSSVGRQKVYFLLLAGIASGIWLPAQGATTYFVDAQVGNDAWSGQQADVSDSGGPWRSLRRAGATLLQPGDTVVLNCGGVWREPLAIGGAGNAEAALSIRAQQGCAEDARPEVNLAELLVNWLSVGEGVFAADAEFAVKQVFVDGRLLDKARYPASGYLAVERGISASVPETGSVGLADSRLHELAGRDVAGAEAYVRTVGWQIEALGVASLAGSSMRFDGATRYPVRKGAGYYLTGKRWMLDKSAGWFWDAGEKRLYVRLPDGASPAVHRLEATRHDFGVRLVNQPYVQISGIRVRNAGLDGVRVERSVQATVADMDILASGRDGISFADGSNGSIQDSAIRESGRDGVSLWLSHGVKVTGNRVENSGMTGGPRNSLAAINATNSNYVHIERNRVLGAGYIGIRFNRNSRVVNNVVRDVCLMLDDCGAIYSWANADPRPLASVVAGNLIENVVGNRTGSPEPWTLAAGVYLDDLSNGITVEGNTISKAERGIYLHNAFANLIQGNTVVESRAYTLAVASDHPRFPVAGLGANTIRSNTLVSMNRRPFIYYLDRMGRGFNDLLDANVYLGQTDETNVVMHRQGATGDAVDAYSAATFRKQAGMSAHGLFRRVGKAPILLVNDGAGVREFACPLSSSVVCERATLPSGEKITWPVRVQPYGSVVVVNG